MKFMVSLASGSTQEINADSMRIDADGVLRFFTGNVATAAFSAGSWLSARRSESE